MHSAVDSADHGRGLKGLQFFSPSFLPSSSASIQGAAASSTTLPEVAAYDDFLDEYGPYGGWDKCDHECFEEMLRKFKAICPMMIAAVRAKAGMDRPCLLILTRERERESERVEIFLAAPFHTSWRTGPGHGRWSDQRECCRAWRMVCHS